METLIFIVFIPVLLVWLLVVLPQQRRVRAHQQLVMSLSEGDEVVLTAGIFGRISRLGPEDLDLEVSPGVELRVARQAVLRRVEHAVPTAGADLEEPEFSEASEAETPRIDSDDAGDNNAQRPGGNNSTL